MTDSFDRDLCVCVVSVDEPPGQETVVVLRADEKDLKSWVVNVSAGDPDVHLVRNYHFRRSPREG